MCGSHEEVAQEQNNMFIAYTTRNIVRRSIEFGLKNIVPTSVLVTLSRLEANKNFKNPLQEKNTNLLCQFKTSTSKKSKCCLIMNPPCHNQTSFSQLMKVKVSNPRPHIQ